MAPAFSKSRISLSLVATNSTSFATHNIGLSSDGFAQAPASVALGRGLCARIECDGAILSHAAVARLDLSMMQAWDLAAQHLLDGAQSEQGIRVHFRVLPQFPEALELKIPGGEATAWLAHPQTFSILNRHFSAQLGREISFLAPTSSTLIVAPRVATRVGQPLFRWFSSQETRFPGRDITRLPIIYSAGFPKLLLPSERTRQRKRSLDTHLQSEKRARKAE